jgi:hypothetical protein
MSRGRCTFRQRDVKAAIKAAVAAGMDVASVEIGAQGQIRIVVGKPGAQELKVNPWDEVLHGSAEQKQTA